MEFEWDESSLRHLVPFTIGQLRPIPFIILSRCLLRALR